MPVFKAVVLGLMQTAPARARITINMTKLICSDALQCSRTVLAISRRGWAVGIAALQR